MPRDARSFLYRQVVKRCVSIFCAVSQSTLIENLLSAAEKIGGAPCIYRVGKRRQRRPASLYVSATQLKGGKRTPESMTSRRGVYVTVPRSGEGGAPAVGRACATYWAGGGTRAAERFVASGAEGVVGARSRGRPARQALRVEGEAHRLHPFYRNQGEKGTSGGSRLFLTHRPSGRPRRAVVFATTPPPTDVCPCADPKKPPATQQVPLSRHKSRDSLTVHTTSD